MRTQVQSLAPISGLRIWCCCELWYRLQLGSGVLCLWHRPVATAAIGPRAWELPYAVGAALKETKRPKKKKIVTGIIYPLLEKLAICLKAILLLFNLILPANNEKFCIEIRSGLPLIAFSHTLLHGTH